MQAGLPDLLIFDRPPRAAERVGCALELKRANGRPSQVTAKQRAWLETLEARGWAAVVAFGFEDAREKLTALGY
jgi:hypothetical protein